MFDKFPTKLGKENDYNKIFDIDLYNDEEKILYFEIQLMNAKEKEEILYLKNIINTIMRNNDE